MQLAGAMQVPTLQTDFLPHIPILMVLVSDRFVIPVGGHDGRQKLFTSVKRYTPQSTARPLCGGTTLVLTHGVTFRRHYPPLFLALK
jgi:hypothetical protein